MATPPDFSVGQVLTAAQMNAVGLWLVKTQTIGSAVSTVTVTDAFSADYENYKITISGGVASTLLAMRFNFDGVTTNYYSAIMYYPYAAGSGNALGVGTGNIGYWSDVGNGSTSQLALDLDVFSPYLTKPSSFCGSTMVLNTSGSTVHVSGLHNASTSHTGFRIALTAGTITGGTIRVYGYRN